MQSTIINIGNSRGVRIPKVLLEQSGIEKDVRITATKGEIRIRKVVPKKTPARLNDEYVLSLQALRKDWDSDQEDKAWQHLQ